jgi:hypothetical protein
MTVQVSAWMGEWVSAHELNAQVSDCSNPDVHASVPVGGVVRFPDKL